MKICKKLSCHNNTLLKLTIYLWLSVFAPFFLFPSIYPFGLIAFFPLKIAAKGAIRSTLRNIDLKFLMTKRLRKLIKICLPINIYNYRL